MAAVVFGYRKPTDDLRPMRTDLPEAIENGGVDSDEFPQTSPFACWPVRFPVFLFSFPDGVCRPEREGLTPPVR